MTPPHSQITPDRIVEIAAHQKLLMYCVLVVVLLSILGPDHAPVEKNTTEEKKVEMKVDAEI